MVISILNFPIFRKGKQDFKKWKQDKKKVFRLATYSLKKGDQKGGPKFRDQDGGYINRGIEEGSCLDVSKSIFR